MKSRGQILIELLLMMSLLALLIGYITIEGEKAKEASYHHLLSQGQK